MDTVTDKRKQDSSICPECKKGFRFKEDNRVLICSGCGYTIDAKRESDPGLLPVRSNEILKATGY